MKQTYSGMILAEVYGEVFALPFEVVATEAEEFVVGTAVRAVYTRHSKFWINLFERIFEDDL